MDLKVELEKLGLDKSAMDDLSNRLQPQTIKKQEPFIQEGMGADKVGLLISGLLVAKYCDDDGNIFTTKFYYERGHRIIADYQNFRSNKPAQESITAIEDSMLLTITKRDFDELTELHPGFAQLSKQLVEDNYLYALGRIRQLQTLSKQKIVSDFFEQHRELFQRAPRKDIASYLGMHRNMLSRALKQI